MQVEILKFLLDVRGHLQDKPGDADTEHLRDLQAVDRVLPDSDWFESGEKCEVMRGSANELWAERGVDLEF
jgi:hypothetical protein